MALTKVDIARLKSTLVQSKIQSTNPALYQVILHLMDDTIQLQDRLAIVLNEIAAATTGTTTLTTIIGPMGMMGLDGEDGQISFFPGPTGARGLTGIQGIPGMDGVSCGDECFCMPFVGNILS